MYSFTLSTVYITSPLLVIWVIRLILSFPNCYDVLGHTQWSTFAHFEAGSLEQQGNIHVKIIRVCFLMSTSSALGNPITKPPHQLHKFYLHTQLFPRQSLHCICMGRAFLQGKLNPFSLFAVHLLFRRWKYFRMTLMGYLLLEISRRHSAGIPAHFYMSKCCNIMNGAATMPC